MDDSIHSVLLARLRAMLRLCLTTLSQRVCRRISCRNSVGIPLSVSLVSASNAVAPVLFEVFYDPAGDAAAGRKIGECIALKPAGILQFMRIDADLTPGVVSNKTGHYLGRKRPVLAADVTDVADLDSGLLPDLPYCTLFQGFSGIQKTGYQAVSPGRPAFLTGQEQLITALYQNDCTGVDVGIMLTLAGWAAFAQASGNRKRDFTATGTVPALFFPVQNLLCQPRQSQCLDVYALVGGIEGF